MPIRELYSKRLKRERGELPDVFQYDRIPDALRVQVVHILDDALQTKVPAYSTHLAIEETFKQVNDVLCREYGLFSLLDRPAKSSRATVVDFFRLTSAERALDTIELSFQVVQDALDQYIYQADPPALSYSDAVKELNQRFLEHGVGYAFESGQLIRKDSELIHREVVQPVLRVLSGKEYQGPNDEFLSAHEHYRHGHYKESVNDCLKALESTLKVICKKRSWPYKETDTAKTLIDVVLSNGLVPSFLQSQLGSLRSLLESGIPTVRNKMAGHGQGSEPKEVPQHIASYVLHMTATTILFLAESERALP